MMDSEPTKPIITVIGSLNVDLVSYAPRIPLAGETLTSTSYHTAGGGKGANQAVAIGRIAGKSVEVRMIGAVGDDEFGNTMKEGIKNHGVNSEDVRVVQGTMTGVAVILVETTSGQNRILISPGANAHVTPPTLPPSLFSSSGSSVPSLLVLQLESPLDTVLQILKLARAHSPHPIPVLLNPAPAIELPDWAYASITYLVLNESEASLLSGISFPEDPESVSPEILIDQAKEAAKWFLERGSRDVIITLGAAGALCVSSEGDVHSVKYTHVAAVKVSQVVDTTAAGDTFIGAFSVKLVESQTSQESNMKTSDLDILVDAAKFAAKASAWTIQRKGTWDAMPTREDLI